MGNGSCEYRDQPILELPGVISVGAVNDRGSKWNYSNIGSDLDIVAPSGSEAPFGWDPQCGPRC